MWITTRAPEFGILISQKKYKELDRLLFYSGRVSVGIACLGSVIIFLFVFWLYHCCLPIAYRFLPPLPTFFFLCATILMQISTSQSTYLRAHKKEPLMLLSLLSGIITALSVIIVGSRWGSLGIAVSYFAMVAFFGLPFGSIIWFRSRNTWHSDNFADPEIVQSGVM
jgi:Na+-driven multidrug efflux pump